MSCASSTRALHQSAAPRSRDRPAVAYRRSQPRRRRVVVRFTHTVQMDWAMPGYPPPTSGSSSRWSRVVHFDGERIASESIYYDQATILRQAGLLTDPKLPVLGAESARSLLEPLPLNQLIHRGAR